MYGPGLITVETALGTGGGEEVIDCSACVSYSRVEARSLGSVAFGRGRGWLEREGRGECFGGAVGFKVEASLDMRLEAEAFDEGCDRGRV